MRSPSESLDLISRYLNDPADSFLREEIAAFRAGSVENELYFNEIEQVWHNSSIAGKLEGTDAAQSAQSLIDKIGTGGMRRPAFIIWLRGIAASLILIVGGVWLYNRNVEPELLVKSTGNDQIDSVKLNDGSTVVLAGNSEFRYPAEFGSSLRETALVKGKAFFKVSHDPEHPFKVKLNQSNVTVLGTSFNIKLTDQMLELGVKTGKVMFSPTENEATSILSAGQALSYNVLKKEQQTRTAQNLDSWLTKELVFVDTPLEEVCKQLTDYYGVDIQIGGNKRIAKKLNANFSDQRLDDVLLILNETYNIKIKKINNQILLITK